MSSADACGGDSGGCGSVRLPADADGVTWTGDDVAFMDPYGRPHGGAMLVLVGHEWRLKGLRDGNYWHAEECRHIRRAPDDGAHD